MNQQTLAAAFTAAAAEINTLSRAFAETPTEQAAASIDNSQKIYQVQAQMQVAKIDPAADKAITEAYGNAKAAIEAKDGDVYRVQRQLILKGFLHATYTGAKHALDAGNVQEAEPWVQYVQDMARWDANHEAVIAMKDLQAGNKTVRGTVQGAIYGWYASQVKSEIEASIGNMKKGHMGSAHVEAIEAAEYLKPIEPEMGTKLGATKMKELNQQLAQYHDATAKKDLPRAEGIAKTIVGILE